MPLSFLPACEAMFVDLGQSRASRRLHTSEMDMSRLNLLCASGIMGGRVERKMTSWVGWRCSAREAETGVQVVEAVMSR